MNSRQRNQVLIFGALALGVLVLWPKKGTGAPPLPTTGPTPTPVTNTEDLGRLIAWAFDDASYEYGIPDGMLRSMAGIESGFRPEVISGEVKGASGEIGIMQITPKWHPDVDPYDPVASIWYAAGWLRELYEQFGGWREAVAAYNWGPTNLANYGLAAAPTVTQDYIAKVAQETGI